MRACACIALVRAWGKLQPLLFATMQGCKMRASSMLLRMPQPPRHSLQSPWLHLWRSAASAAKEVCQPLLCAHALVQVYTIYSVLFIVFVILVIVTAFVTVALTYFQLAVEDHRWVASQQGCMRVRAP